MLQAASLHGPVAEALAPVLKDADQPFVQASAAQAIASVFQAARKLHKANGSGGAGEPPALAQLVKSSNMVLALTEVKANEHMHDLLFVSVGGRILHLKEDTCL